MGKTYRIGARFRKLKYFSATVNCLVVLCFYFIYRFVLGGLFPNLPEAALAAVFLLLGALVAKATLAVAERYAAGVGYRVTEEGLVVLRGGRESLLKWRDFSGARLLEFQFQGVFPVQFRVAGETLLLNQYLDGLCELTSEVLTRIAPYAEIEPELMERAKQMKGVY